MSTTAITVIIADDHEIFRDGLKLMKEGETITFLFPSYKAFGYYGINNKLGTNVPVQCTVTLNTITQNN